MICVISLQNYLRVTFVQIDYLNLVPEPTFLSTGTYLLRKRALAVTDLASERSATWSFLVFRDISMQPFPFNVVMKRSKLMQDVSVIECVCVCKRWFMTESHVLYSVSGSASMRNISFLIIPYFMHNWILKKCFQLQLVTSKWNNHMVPFGCSFSHLNIWFLLGVPFPI